MLTQAAMTIWTSRTQIPVRNVWLAKRKSVPINTAGQLNRLEATGALVCIGAHLSRSHMSGCINTEAVYSATSTLFAMLRDNSGYY